MFELESQSGWVLKQKLTAQDRASGNSFGWSVDIHGDYIIAGAYQDTRDAQGTGALVNAGSAYIFNRQQDGSWLQQQKIVADDRNFGDFFGYSVAIDGTRLVIGAYGEDDNLQGGDPKQLAGSAYVFELAANGSFTQHQKLNAPDRTADDRFGYSVAIDGNSLLIGAHMEDDNADGQQYLSGAGSAYLFARSAGGTWSFQQKLVGQDRLADALSGSCVALSDGNQLVGAPGHNNRKGTASIFGHPTVLPVILKDFTARLSNELVLLEWHTLTENGNREFIISRSVDGSGFSEIARVAGAGNSNGEKTYVYKDRQVKNGTVYYYLLQQSDHDGRIVDHGIRSVAFQLIPAQATVFPNPTTGPIYLRLPPTPGKSIKVTISNLSGQVVHSETIANQTGSIQHQLKIAGTLAAGLYMIDIASGTITHQLKLMVRE